MPPIPAGHVLLKFRFRLATDPEEMLCTLGAETTAASNADRISALNDQFDNWADNVLPLQVVGYSLVGVDGVFGTGGGDLPLSSTQGPANAGNPATGLTSNTAVLVQKLSAVGGRRNKGRMYVPGINPEAVDNAGFLTGVDLAAWNTAFNNLYLGVTSGTFLDNPVIFHSVGDPTPTVVTDLDVDPRVATQRRRMRP